MYMANISLVLLLVGGKILMCKREKKESDKYSEMFGLPGGHVKKDESNKDGAIRETKEETNLTITNPKFIKTYDMDDNQIHLFAKEIKNIDDIKLNHEHTEHKLVSPSNLKDPEIIPTTKDMYKDYKNKPLNEEVERIKDLIVILTEDISAIRKDKKKEIFDYHSISSDAWRELIGDAQKIQKISFDLENDDSM